MKMKIKEFIEKVNKIAYAEYEHNNISIYDTHDKAQKKDWFLYINPSKQSLNDAVDWESADSMGTVDLFYILGLVQELRKTPVKDRFPEKKYYLCVFPKKKALEWSGESEAIWVNHIESFDDGFHIEYGPKTAFTEETLNTIEESLPFIAPTIEAMKEPVEDIND